MSARVEWLEVVGDPTIWRSIGLVVDADGFIPLMGTSLKVAAPSDPDATGIVGWSLSGVDGRGAGEPDAQDIDGLATEAVAPRPPIFAHHEIGASGLDHVVVTTDDLERTSGAIEQATGAELKRIREVGDMRQGFHRIGRGGLIVELVSRPDVVDGPATFWGLVINVEDLDAACRRIGDERISSPKDAVQPGRRIATISGEVGLGFPVALMTSGHVTA